jgi:hypothetical protein
MLRVVQTKSHWFGLGGRCRNEEVAGLLFDELHRDPPFERVRERVGLQEQ